MNLETILQKQKELAEFMEELNKAISELKNIEGQADPRIGKYCYFWDSDGKPKYPYVGVLAKIENGQYRAYMYDGEVAYVYWKNCELLPFQPDDIKAEDVFKSPENYEITYPSGGRLYLEDHIAPADYFKIRRKKG